MTSTNDIIVNLRRDRHGITVMVKTTPEIEEFFKHWGSGAAEGTMFGRLWKNPDDPTKKVLVWSFEPPYSTREGEASYSLIHTGQGLMTEFGSVNLSFLRLVGSSEGVTVSIETMISREELDRVCAKLKKAIGDFYRDYIQTLNMQIYVGVKHVA